MLLEELIFTFSGFLIHWSFFSFTNRLLFKSTLFIKGKREVLVIYGNVNNLDSCALSHVINIRKSCPQVCLLSKITLNNDGNKVLSKLIEDLILFDPATIRNEDDYTLLNQNVFPT